MSYKADREVYSRYISARNSRAMAAARANLPRFNIPVADSRYTSPGLLFLGEYYYSYPDVAYPWDPAVVRAIREFEPTAMPVCVRSIWQQADYGNLEPPFAIVRHGIATSVRDPLIPTHKFRCELPVHSTPSLFAEPHALARVAPNYIQRIWYDSSVRPWGWDRPGAYLGFDWGLYHFLYRNYENGRRAKDIADDYIDGAKTKKERLLKSNKEEKEYIDRDVEQDIARRDRDASDVDKKNAILA